MHFNSYPEFLLAVAGQVGTSIATAITGTITYMIGRTLFCDEHKGGRCTVCGKATQHRTSAKPEAAEHEHHEPVL
jgi:hypothetical protein